MATCEKVEQTPVPPPVEYRLTLSDGEARMLRELLCAHIVPMGAEPLMSVQRALYEAGVGRVAGVFRSNHVCSGTLKYHG